MIRSRGSIKATSQSWSSTEYRNSDTAIMTSSAGSGNLFKGKTEVIDWDDSKRNGRMYLTRKCDHNVISLDCNTYRCKYESRPGYHGIDVGFGHPPDFNDFPTTLPIPVCPHMDALSYFQSGCVPKELELANSLIEIREIPRLVTGLPQLWKQLRTKHPDKAVAGGFLGVEFGLKPLIDDIKGIFKAVSDLQNKLRWLRDNNGKPVKVKFHKEVIASHSTSEILDTGNSAFVRSVTQNALYGAYAIIQYDVRALSDMELYLRSARRQLGLTDLLSIAWEAIPWSWVIDHYLKVGNFLSSLPDFITLPNRIIHAGWWVKNTMSVEVQRNYYKPYGHGSHRLYSYEVKRFFREPGLPVTFASLETSLPTAKQLALEIAASIQKL